MRNLPPRLAETAESTARDAAKPISVAAVLACAWPALLLATVCLLPFLNKPFNIDDPYFLMVAQQIVKHPSHPMNFGICWNGEFAVDCRQAYQFASGNPLLGQVAQGYVLVPTVLGGGHEWAAHLTQLVLIWIAVIAMTSLVFRFGRDRWHAMSGALLLVAIPPFLPMANTAMPDILSTTLALIAIERLAAWKAEQKWSQALAASIALGLAGFARPHLSLLIPLAAFFMLESTEPREMLAQIRRRPWRWTPVIAGLGLLSIIILATREHGFAVSTPPGYISQRNTLRNLCSYLLYFAVPLPLAICWLLNRLKAGRILHICGVLAVATLCLLLKRPSLVPFFVIIGAAVFCYLIFETLKSRDHFGLFVLLWLLMPLPIVYYVHLPMKYLLPCVPAVIFICFRWMDGFSALFVRASVLLFVIASTAYSILILRSDAEFAEFGRDALYLLIKPHVAAGEKVWFPGQYWSFWYAPLDGASLTFPGGPQPKSGDLIVIDELAAGAADRQLERFPRRVFVDAVTHKYRFGRTMGPGIGLYSNGSGFWLWGFSESKHDRFELWRID
jgi:hypothetical protein